eukprot:1469610-Alexandrium_andersonii.AAC.1
MALTAGAAALDTLGRYNNLCIMIRTLMWTIPKVLCTSESLVSSVLHVSTCFVPATILAARMCSLCSVT